MSVIDVSKIKKTENVLALISKDYPAYQQIIELLNSVSNSVSELAAAGQTYNHIIIVSGANVTGLQQLAQQLNAGGSIGIYQSTQQNLTLDLLMNGLVDVVQSEANGLFVTSATKPDWNQGTSDTVKIEAKSAGWGAINNDATMDENDLLSETDKNAKPSTSLDDCEVGSKKKACKNCTCGRAEMEAAGEEPPKPKLTKEMLDNPGVNSNCGSCSLGDAFRCKGCPYRGLPAFKVGEKIVLPDDFLTDDI
ncbi:hypothetical protein PPL_02327 [Heterostelium album PN500]|uniref:Anamorsin homolog n=1 Tax=Heterostelium pallidum (strain ATCC 26659 / Pp 5 / PN500) TaxID=670386 RepID=D3B202_HETP5|nr:hypothetical protein PPL_02327 [Heterostelium album PN500]EFA85326.1 hypothetical protein PPL_02327 [Heterostelium album PN500]|eukprot:XP_020437435.1 hypothetical protein PPL_02327 [Heterostelium album PN500]